MKRYTQWAVLCVASVAAITFALWWFGPSGARWRFERERSRAVAERKKAPPAWEKEFVKNTKPIAAIFAGATRVECFRMMPALEAQAEMGNEKQVTLLRLPYKAKATDRDAAFATRLGSIVLSPDSYVSYNRACSFNPTVGFRVWKGQQRAVVIVCFGCDQLLLVEEQSYLASTKTASTVPYQLVRSCDAARPELIRLAREVFPDDPDLQSLNEYKRE